MAPGEVGQEVGVGARERVDRLGRVAHHTDLVATAEPQVEERRLQGRDVLVLVDDEPLVLAADLGGDPLVLGQHARSEEQDVLHVHPTLLALDVLVGGEEVADRGVVVALDGAVAPGRDLGVVIGGDVADLGPLDLGREVAQQRLVGTDPLAARGRGQQSELGLDQRRQLGATPSRPEVAQLTQRRGVEGAGLDTARTQLAQASAHLAGRAGGEGDRQHLGGGVDPGDDPVGDAMGDRPRLARAGTGQHPDRTAQRLGDQPLLGVERGQQIAGSRGC